MRSATPNVPVKSSIHKNKTDKHENTQFPLEVKCNSTTEGNISLENDADNFQKHNSSKSSSLSKVPIRSDLVIESHAKNSSANRMNENSKKIKSDSTVENIKHSNSKGRQCCKEEKINIQVIQKKPGNVGKAFPTKSIPRFASKTSSNSKEKKEMKQQEKRADVSKKTLPNKSILKGTSRSDLRQNLRRLSGGEGNNGLKIISDSALPSSAKKVKFKNLSVKDSNKNRGGIVNQSNAEDSSDISSEKTNSTSKNGNIDSVFWNNHTSEEQGKIICREYYSKNAKRSLNTLPEKEMSNVKNLPVIPETSFLYEPRFDNISLKIEDAKISPGKELPESRNGSVLNKKVPVILQNSSVSGDFLSTEDGGSKLTKQKAENKPMSKFAESLPIIQVAESNSISQVPESKSSKRASDVLPNNQAYRIIPNVLDSPAQNTPKRHLRKKYLESGNIEIEYIPLVREVNPIKFEIDNRCKSKLSILENNKKITVSSDDSKSMTSIPIAVHEYHTRAMSKRGLLEKEVNEKVKELTIIFLEEVKQKNDKMLHRSYKTIDQFTDSDYKDKIISESGTDSKSKTQKFISKSPIKRNNVPSNTVKSAKGYCYLQNPVQRGSYQEETDANSPVSVINSKCHNKDLTQSPRFSKIPRILQSPKQSPTSLNLDLKDHQLDKTKENSILKFRNFEGSKGTVRKRFVKNEEFQSKNDVNDILLEEEVSKGRVELNERTYNAKLLLDSEEQKNDNFTAESEAWHIRQNTYHPSEILHKLALHVENEDMKPVGIKKYVANNSSENILDNVQLKNMNTELCEKVDSLCVKPCVKKHDEVKTSSDKRSPNQEDNIYSYGKSKETKVLKLKRFRKYAPHHNKRKKWYVTSFILVFTFILSVVLFLNADVTSPECIT